MSYLVRMRPPATRGKHFSLLVVVLPLLALVALAPLLLLKLMDDVRAEKRTPPVEASGLVVGVVPVVVVVA